MNVPAIFIVMAVPVAPEDKSKLPPVWVKLFTFSVYPPVVPHFKNPEPVEATVNVPVMPVVELLPRLMIPDCEGQFQVKFEKVCAIPDSAVVLVVYPMTLQLEPAFHVAVGIVPCMVVYLCSYVPLMTKVVDVLVKPAAVIPPNANVPVAPTVVTLFEKLMPFAVAVVLLISSLPSMALTAPEAKASDNAAVVPLETKALPAGIVRLPIVSVDAAEAWKLAMVLFPKTTWDTVCAGTPVTVEFPPLVKLRISVGSIVALLGDQLAAVAQSAEPVVAFQVYVAIPVVDCEPVNVGDDPPPSFPALIS